MTDLILLGCGKKKRTQASAAQEMYTSSLFKLRRKYVLSRQCSPAWRIVSAKHYVLKPEHVIEPYDCRLKPDGARDWAGRVWLMLMADAILYGWKTVELHMGSEYASALCGSKPLGYTVTLPVKGLDLFEQLKWYKEKT
jgi:hypothetical protein